MDCRRADDAIEVNTSTNGDDWVSSRIELPLPGPTSVGCYGWPDLNWIAAVGPQGIIMRAFFSGEVSSAAIVGAEVSRNFLDSEVTRVVDWWVEAVEDGFLVLTTHDGDVHRIDLDATGHLDDLETILGATSEDPDFASLVMGLVRRDWRLSQEYAWFSPDGQTWNQIDAPGPGGMGGIGAIVAMPDGFVVGVDGADVLWETTNGATWTQKSTLAESHLMVRMGVVEGDSPAQPGDQEYGDVRGLDVWDGRLVAVTTNGVWTIEDTPQQLIPAEGTNFERMQRGIGGLGLVAVNKEQGGGRTKILFSADGTTWNRWNPPEFGPPNQSVLYLVGVGDDFVVLERYGESESYPGSLWVGKLP